MTLQSVTKSESVLVQSWPEDLALLKALTESPAHFRQLVRAVKPTEKLTPYQHKVLYQAANLLQQQYHGTLEAEAMREVILNSHLFSEITKEDMRVQTWEINHTAIINGINAYIEENGRMPSAIELADSTGLSRQAVYRHLKGFQLSERHSLRVQQFRLMAENVMTQMYSLAMEGDTRAAKVFLGTLGGLSKPEGAIPQTNNYIQVNNNLKVDQVTFMNLPEPIQQQIIKLIEEGLKLDN